MPLPVSIASKSRLRRPSSEYVWNVLENCADVLLRLSFQASDSRFSTQIAP
jgi:hypothetical protein